MSDGVNIRDADGNKVKIGAVETDPGSQTQRVVPQVSAGGGLADVSGSDPLPVQGPVTDSELRAAPVLVDTELPVAAVPTDSDFSAAVPAIVSRAEAYRRDVGRWARVSMSSGAEPTTSIGVPTSAPYHHDNTQTQSYAALTARSLGDTETGTAFPGAGQMLFNGTAWERSRSSTNSITAISAGDRGADGSTISFPAFSLYNAIGVWFALRVFSPGTGKLALVIKQQGTTAMLATLNCDAAIFSGATPSQYVDTAMVLYPGATLGNAEQAATAAATRWGTTCFSTAVGRTVTGYVQHADTSTWNYSLACGAIL